MEEFKETLGVEQLVVLNVEKMGGRSRRRFMVRFPCVDTLYVHSLFHLSSRW